MQQNTGEEHQRVKDKRDLPLSGEQVEQTLKMSMNSILDGQEQGQCDQQAKDCGYHLLDSRFDDRPKTIRFQTGTPDQTTVNIGLIEQLRCISGLYAAAIEHPGSGSNIGAK